MTLSWVEKTGRREQVEHQNATRPRRFPCYNYIRIVYQAIHRNMRERRMADVQKSYD